jgi:CheY-like chemotaxis protein
MPASRQTKPMRTSHSRAVPLVVIGTAERAAADALASLLRGEGATVLVAEGERACLRIATSVAPDIILLDPRLPRGLQALLRAHPFSNSARISRSGALAATVQGRRHAPAATS